MRPVRPPSALASRRRSTAAYRNPSALAGRRLFSRPWRALFGAALLAALLGSLPAGPRIASAGNLSGNPPLSYRTLVDNVELNRIGIRFEPATEARVRGGRLVSLSGADLSAARRIAFSVPGAQLAPRFPLSEQELDRLRSVGQSRTRQDLPDLNLFALLTLPPAGSEQAGRDRLRTLLHDLNAAPGVAEAWALPVAEPSTATPISPARISPATRTLLSPSDRPRAGRPRSDTPDFSPLQGYLYDPPVGFWADSAWTFPGGMGQGVKVMGMEWGWLWTHEDLKDPFYTYNDQGPSDHGTAVFGIIAGQHNGYGINGIAPEVQFGGMYLSDIASDILRTVSVLSPGDVYNMSIQVGGPLGWMPTEWWPDCFAAIQTGSSLGVIAMEAAGNSSLDLDDPLYGGAFDRRIQDSGGFIIGAGTPQGLDAEGFSNYGSRCSLQGWGSSVVTTCCGDLQGGDPTVCYTAGFNGTSSATPCCAGSVASLQGQALALFGVPLTPPLAEEILRATGSPYHGTKYIGPRPNLIAARQRLLRGFGNVLVTVRDGDTQQPMPAMIVEIAETGRLSKTGSGGQTAMQLTAGALTFHVSGNFYYTEADFPFTVQAGGNQEAVLDVYRTPVGSISGIVRDQGGHPITGARILARHTPIDTVWSGAFGSYTVSGVPQDTGYTVTASNVPTKGAAYLHGGVVGGQVTSWDPFLVDAETFENGPANYTPTGDWECGTPTFPHGPNLPIPFSGTRCWGTVLAGVYHNLTTSILTSPVFDLSGKTHLTLSFHHWMWIESDDGGQVQVWDAAQNKWVVVYPVLGYPDNNIIILNYGPGYNGHQTTWEPAIFPLDQYAGRNFQFRLYFKTNYENYGVGWYIDDVALDTGQGPAAVDLTPGSDSGPTRILWTGPNPASGPSVIRFLLGSAVEARCEVYNPGGALVRRLATATLRPGENEIRWDGRDEAGRPAGSGVYLYRLTAGTDVLRGRLLRVR